MHPVVNLINVPMIVNVSKSLQKICTIEVVPTDTKSTQLRILVKQWDAIWLLSHIINRSDECTYTVLMNSNVHMNLYKSMLLYSFRD